MAILDRRTVWIRDYAANVWTGEQWDKGATQ